MSIRIGRPQGRHDAHLHRRRRRVPVTVLDVSDNRVTQVKTAETDGYAAVQVAFGKRRASRVNKPLPATSPRRASKRATSCRNSASSAEELAELKAGAQARRRASSRSARRSTCRASTIGKGFAGAIKRHHFSRSARRTATAVRTTCPARSAWRRTRAACSRASDVGPPRRRQPHHRRTSTSSASTPSASCCWSRARCPAPKNGHVVVRPAVEGAEAPKGASRASLPRRAGKTDGTQDSSTTRARRGDRRRRRTPCSAATTTKRWCTRSSSPTRRTRARARARRRTAARSTTRPRSRGARRAPAARAPA